MKDNNWLNGLKEAFDVIRESYKADPSSLRAIKNELNNIFADSTCKEVIYTANNDNMFFGVKVLPVIDADDIYDYLIDTEPMRLTKYIVEIDSHLLNPVLALTSEELASVLINEVNALVGDSTPVELARTALNHYLAINGDHVRISKSIHYKEIIAYGLKDYLSKCRSMFYNTSDTTDLYTNDLVVSYGIASALEKAYTKIRSNNIKLYQDSEVSKFITFSWALNLYKDIKYRRVGAMHVLSRAKLLTGSVLEKMEIDNVIKRIRRIDDDVINEGATLSDIDEKNRDNMRKARINSLKLAESTFCELNMRIRHVEDADDALYLMNQINTNISLIEAYMNSGNMDEYEKEKWMSIYDRFVMLKQNLSNTIVYRNKNSGLFVNYPTIAENRY